MPWRNVVDWRYSSTTLDLGLNGGNWSVHCDSRLLSNQDVSYKLCVLQRISIGETPPLYDGQEEWGAALGGCGMSKVTVHGEFSRRGEHRYLQQLQFFAHCFRDLLPLFSVPNFFKTRPCLIRHWFLDMRKHFCSFKLVLYPFKTCNAN
jgi:hypothetical protein